MYVYRIDYSGPGVPKAGESDDWEERHPSVAVLARDVPHAVRVIERLWAERAIEGRVIERVFRGDPIVNATFIHD